MLRRSVGRAKRKGGDRPPGRPHRRHRLLAGAVLFLAAAGWLLIWLDGNVRPVMMANARYECERYANAAFRTALAQQDEEAFQDLYTLSSGADGEIQAVLLDSGRISRLEASLAQQIQAELTAQTAGHTLTLPLAVLLGGQLWAGPRLTLRLLPDAFVAVDIYDTLESAGINQTRLCLWARYTAQMSMIVAGYGATTNVEQEVLLAEVLLAGDVPQGYLNDYDA